MKIYLNNDWEFTFNYEDDFKNSEVIRIPHTVKEIDYNYCFEKEYETISGYKKTFKYQDEFKNKRVFINFEGVGHQAEVIFNNKSLGIHNSGYTGFKYEITDLLAKNNEVIVKVNSKEDLNIPPFGNVIDYYCYGGIYRDVYLTIEENTFIEDVYSPTIFENNNWFIEASVKLNGNDKGPIKYEILDTDKVIINGSSSDLNFKIKCENITPWDIDNPKLYTIRYYFNNSIYEHLIGFRTVKFKADGFYLNNKKLKIRGLNRHQCYPYVGYAMPDSMQIDDAHNLKYKLGVNTVRTSHYSDSHSFISECDKIGLLVIPEIPGWQHIGDEEWKGLAISNVGEMILQYHNHPSIILWGVRINESVDDDDFYTKTNKLAHELDKYRQTTGVRYLTGSSLLEDVYGHNDFSYAGIGDKGLKTKKKAVGKKESMEKGYFVSEHNGHMYPTKSFDDEAHQLSQALRHTTVLNTMYSEEDIGGAIGWCYADYNTHKDFGSGDRICYHGVLDMYRNPKLAAYVYACQADREPILELSSSMNIGEYPGGNIGDVWCFTNADYIKLYKNDEFVADFYPSDKYKYLPHPPILVNDFIGELIEKHEKFDKKTCVGIKECLQAVAKYGMDNLPPKYLLKLGTIALKNKLTMADATMLYGKYVTSWGGNTNVYRIDAIKDNKVVKSITKEPATSLNLKVECERDTLIESKSYDVTEIKLKVVDQNNNIGKYYGEAIEVETNNNIELIGPHLVTFKSGQVSIYIKSIKEGKGLVTIKSDRFETQTINIDVKKEECKAI